MNYRNATVLKEPHVSLSCEFGCYVVCRKYFIRFLKQIEHAPCTYLFLSLALVRAAIGVHCRVFLLLMLRPGCMSLSKQNETTAWLGIRSSRSWSEPLGHFDLHVVGEHLEEICTGTLLEDAALFLPTYNWCPSC